MNKKTKQNLKKRVAPLALAGIVVLGASAWLHTNETQTATNKIVSGTTTLKFTDVEGDGNDRVSTKINISGNTVIPMTEAFATANLNPYKFKLDNRGSIDLNYDVYLVCDNSTFGANVLAVDLDGTDGTRQLITAVSAGGKQKIASGTLKAGEKVDYTEMRIHAIETAKNADMLDGEAGRTAQFHLEVEARQTNEEVETTAVFMVNGKLAQSATAKGLNWAKTGPSKERFVSEFNTGKYQYGGPSIIHDDTNLYWAKYSENRDTYELKKLYTNPEHTQPVENTYNFTEGTHNFYTEDYVAPGV